MASPFKSKAETLAPRRTLMSAFDRDARTGGQATVADRGEYERGIFHNMINRTVQVFTRRRFQHPSEKGQSSAGWKGSVRIACLNSDLPIDKDRGEMWGESLRDGCFLLRPTDAFNPRRWVNERLLELRAALRHDPHIICFPEFAYPPAPRSLGGGWTLPEIDTSVRRKLEFDARALALLSRYQNKSSRPFVFLGSYHCLMTLYNVGVVYPWGDLPDGEVVRTSGPKPGSDAELSEAAEGEPRATVSTPIIYRKRFPARKLGEQARVPDGQEFNVFERKFAKIGLLICSDTLDLNQFLQLVRESVDFYEGFEIILIPSYSPKGRGTFETMCEELSYLTGTAVVTTCAANSLAARGMSKTDLYLFGRRASKQRWWRDGHASGVLKKNTPFRATSRCRGMIYEIDMQRFREARNAHLRSLLGEQTATRIADHPA